MMIATVKSIKYKYFSDDDISELTCLGISRILTSGENDTLILFLLRVGSGEVIVIEPEEFEPISCAD